MTAPPVSERGTDLAAKMNGVTLHYGQTLALDNVSLELPVGQITGLIGPDGVGKSSLFSLLAGARMIQGGTIDVLGGDMGDRRHREAVCPRIAYMPQGLGKNLYPTLSVLENLDFFGRLFGQDGSERNRRITELVDSTGLKSFLDRPVGKLSGGMNKSSGCAARSSTIPTCFSLTNRQPASIRCRGRSSGT